MASGSIISTIGSGTLSLQNTKGSSTKIDSQEQKALEASSSLSKDGDGVSTQKIEERAAVLNTILDGISQSIQTIEKTQKSAEKIFSLLRQGLNFARQASEQLVPPNMDTLSSLKVKFNNILRQIDMAADSAAYRGINLLKNDNLETSFGANARNNITTKGFDASARGLGIEDASFSNATTVQQATDQVTKAIKLLEDFTKYIGGDDNLIRTRQSFTKETIGSIDTASKAIDTDEGANLLALKIGQQLAQIGENSLASNDQKDLLRLF